MITVVYNAKNGISLPDGLVAEYVDGIIKSASSDVHIVVGNGMIIDEFRVRIAKSEISSDEIRFFYNGVFLPHTNGRLHSWPEGFCDYNQKQLYQLMIKYANEK